MRNKISNLIVVGALVGLGVGCDQRTAEEKQQALEVAIEKGNVEEVKALLVAGAKVDAMGEAGRQSIHHAAVFGNAEIIKTLLEYGAKVDVTDQTSWRPIHYAALHGHVEAVKVLLAAGAKVDAVADLAGAKVQPLHCAAKNGSIEVVKVLLLSGAKVDVETGYGQTPVEVAHASKHFELAGVLLAQTLKEFNDEMVKLVVPKVDSPTATPTNAPRLVVSVTAANGVISKVMVGPVEIAPTDHWAALTKAITDGKAEKTKGLNKQDAKKFEVLLRADLSLPFKEVQPIMNAISAAGVENVNLMAYKVEAEEAPPSN